MDDDRELPGDEADGADALRSLLERARGGDESALPSLREAFDDSPEAWDVYGDLASHARELWISLIAGPDLGLAEALRRRAEALLAEVAGPEPSPLELLLAGRVAASALQVWHAEAAGCPAGSSEARERFLRRRLDAAQRRHLAAISALASVRKLLQRPDAAGERRPRRGQRPSRPGP
jgi:hypothetical protein